MRRLGPISLFVGVFALAFGVAAIPAGLTEWQALLMSAAVFAGTAQFAALELWGPSISLPALLAVTLAINARMFLMSATLYPWMRDLPPAQRYTSMLVLTDANWAMAMADYHNGRRNLGILVGGGIVLWLAWVVGTLVGVLFGTGIEDPERYGLDMIMGCFMLSMLGGSRMNLATLVPWLAAALAALAAVAWLPPNSHVVVGALAGGAAGLLVPATGQAGDKAK